MILLLFNPNIDPVILSTESTSVHLPPCRLRIIVYIFIFHTKSFDSNALLHVFSVSLFLAVLMKNLNCENTNNRVTDRSFRFHLYGRVAVGYSLSHGINQKFGFGFAPTVTWNSCSCRLQFDNLFCKYPEYFQSWLGMRLHRCADQHHDHVIRFVSFLIHNLVGILSWLNHRFELGNENTMGLHRVDQRNKMKQNWIELDEIHHFQRYWYSPNPKKIFGHFIQFCTSFL